MGLTRFLACGPVRWDHLVENIASWFGCIAANHSDVSSISQDANWYEREQTWGSGKGKRTAILYFFCEVLLG